MHVTARAKQFHFLNKIDKLREIKIAEGDGLILDEQCLSTRDVDDVKALPTRHLIKKGKQTIKTTCICDMDNAGTFDLIGNP